MYIPDSSATISMAVQDIKQQVNPSLDSKISWTSSLPSLWEAITGSSW